MRAFRIVVAAHGDLADAFVSAASLICGPLRELHPVGLRGDESPEAFGERLRDACGAEGPLLILTDLVGGTPHNVAFALARRRPSAVVISGVNLAVLIEAATSIDVLDDATIERLVSLGREALADLASVVASHSS